MSTYRLVDHGYSFKKIMHGRKWVGRVYNHADGTWRGAINKVELSKEATAIAAFDEAVARHLGYDNVRALRNRNATVRASNRAKRATARALGAEFLDPKTPLSRQMDILDKVFKLVEDK